MGNWTYYATTMRVSEFLDRVGFAVEMRHAERYGDWMQREVRPKRLEQIANYLVDREERFFSSLVVSVYAGAPTWIEFSLLDTTSLSVDDLTSLEVVTIDESLGLLKLNGEEDLFALDGQHRLGGLREAIRREPARAADIVSVLFVADRGIEQTRRLFTTLNRYATKVSPGERVILDEDDAFAIVTRTLIETHPFLMEADRVSSPKQTSLSAGSVNLTTPLTIYNICDILCSGLRSGKELGDNVTPWTKPTLTESIRPDERVITGIHSVATKFWTKTAEAFSLAIDGASENDLSGEQSQRSEGALIWRPVGQMAFARAVRHIIDASPMRSDDAVPDAVNTLCSGIAAQYFSVHDAVWNQLLWNPVKGTVYNGVERQKVAARLLCYLAGQGDPIQGKTSLLDSYRKLVGDPDANIPAR
jgi:DNA sulfur modification protein DndB